MLMFINHTVNEVKNKYIKCMNNKINIDNNVLNNNYN